MEVANHEFVGRLNLSTWVTCDLSFHIGSEKSESTMDHWIDEPYHFVLSLHCLDHSLSFRKAESPPVFLWHFCKQVETDHQQTDNGCYWLYVAWFISISRTDVNVKTRYASWVVGGIFFLLRDSPSFFRTGHVEGTDVEFVPRVGWVTFG